MTSTKLVDGPEELYYECEPCGYCAPAAIAVGLCPHCGDRLIEQNPLK